MLYAQDRRTKDVVPFLTLHDDGTLTSDDPHMTKAIPRYREKRGWSNRRIFEYFATKSNAYVRYYEEPGGPRPAGGGTAAGMAPATADESTDAPPPARPPSELPSRPRPDAEGSPGHPPPLSTTPRKDRKDQ
ncbi:hypothetical protein ACFOVU_07800 [Nocardiopsis sediminis]|uniref:Uncharacterized protein n=1 Tax=Nocardiopsis sediminis TaxID=1778267 RepID=A0ABV8FKC7_9ACTN